MIPRPLNIPDCDHACAVAFPINHDYLLDPVLLEEALGLFGVIIKSDCHDVTSHHLGDFRGIVLYESDVPVGDYACKASSPIDDWES